MDIGFGWESCVCARKAAGADGVLFIYSWAAAVVSTAHALYSVTVLLAGGPLSMCMLTSWFASPPSATNG